MGFISWIIFGALVGFLANIFMDSKEGLGCLGSIVVGIVGSFIGGSLLTLLQTGKFSLQTAANFSLEGIIVSLIGAVLFIGFVKLLTDNKN